jgi:hypothetical protein
MSIWNDFNRERAQNTYAEGGGGGSVIFLQTLGIYEVFALWRARGGSKISKNCVRILCSLSSGVESKNNVYHIVDKVQNLYENTLKLDLIDNVVYVVFALYSRVNDFPIFRVKLMICGPKKLITTCINGSLKI